MPVISADQLQMDVDHGTASSEGDNQTGASPRAGTRTTRRKTPAHVAIMAAIRRASDLFSCMSGLDP